MELIAELADDTVGVGTLTIELVDEGKTGNVVTLHLTIDSDGLGLDAYVLIIHE